MAKSYFRENVDEMSPYVPGEQPADGERVVKLNTNENPYPASPRVAEAVNEVMVDARLYPDPVATGLRAAAAEAWGFEPAQIIAGNGSDELLAMLIRAVVPPGEKVAYPVPTYSLYRTLVKGHGAESVTVQWPDDYTLPMKELASSGARLVFVARPNAPTGTVVALDALAALARGLDGVVCVDEAYADFAEDNAFGLVREFGNVIVLRTLSKSFSLAGARVGLGFAQEPLIDGLNKIKDSYNLSRMALAAGEAAVRDLEWMKANVAKVRRTRTRLVGELGRLGVSCTASHANFVFASIGPKARNVYEALKARGILVRYFDEDRVRHGLRITVGTDEEVDELLKALAEILPA